MSIALSDAGSENDGVAILKVVSGHSALLHFGGRDLSAMVGRDGVRTDKHEGDGTTPTGLLPLRRLLYRSDRLHAPKTSVLCEPLTEMGGWCDDATHPDYNRQVQLPHSARHEKLWLDDRTYDIIGILGYNDDPVIPGRGSAIFLHITNSKMTPTDGCIALSTNDLLWVLDQGLQAILVQD